MATLMTASNQWSSRPDDQRFTSLPELASHFEHLRSNSRAVVVSTRKINAEPLADNVGLQITGPNGHGYAPTHWSFGQLAQLAEAPAGYLRRLPSPMVADALNWGLQKLRNAEDVGLLITRDTSGNYVRAATGPKYGRIWNADIATALVNKFGDGVTGDWKVPGEFGHAVDVTKANTTIYGSDRDMFVFLADEKHRIEIPNRRNGSSGSLARGFYVWNSEVGDSVFGIGTFLFDYVCCNRIIWGAEEYREIRIRHTASAPDRFIEEMHPALIAYANSSARTITDGVAKAQAARLEPDAVSDFLAKRFGKRMVPHLQMVHKTEEDRPIETLWDVATAATAYARGMEHQNERVAIERIAGDVLELAANP